MPDGKPAGVRCALLADERCGIFGQPSGRPSAAGCGRRPRCAGAAGSRRCTGWAGWSGKLPCLPEPVLGPVATDGDKNGLPDPFHHQAGRLLRVRAAPARRGFHNAPPPLPSSARARGQAALGQRGAQFGFRTKPFQRLRQLRRCGSCRINASARRQILREAAVGGRADHHRQAMRHGFQRRHAVAVVQRGMGVDVGRAEILGDLGVGSIRATRCAMAPAPRVRAWLRRPRPPAAGSARAAAPRRPAAPAALRSGLRATSRQPMVSASQPAGRARPGAGRRRRPSSDAGRDDVHGQAGP